MQGQVRLTVRLLVIVVTAALAAGCAGGQSPSPTAVATTAAPSEEPTSSATAEPSGPQELPPPEQSSIRFAISANDTNSFTLQLAHDAGLFEKWGLDSEGFFIEGTQPATQALLAGQVEIASNTASQSVTSLTTDQPLVDVGIVTIKLPDYIFGAKDVATGEDLRGKRVAVSQLGGQSHAEVVVAVRELGLEPEDVQIVSIGGQSARIAALQAGTVEAVPADPAVADALTGEGFTILVKLPESEGVFAGSNIQVRRDWADENPNTTLRIVLACLEAIQMQFNDTEQVAEYYAEFAQLSPEEALEGYQLYVDSGIISRDLRATVESYEPVRDVLLTINEAVADVDISQAFDGSYIDMLEEMGYFEELGIPNS
jgi:NitT/TauT family transport system substrate-binding protein